LSYCIVYFLLNFHKKKTKKYIAITIYIFLIALYTLRVNIIMLIPLTFIFSHLIFKTQDSDVEIDLDKSILSFIFKSLPNKNRVVLSLYFFLSILIILFF